MMMYGGLPCAHHGCDRAVTPEAGYCPEHKPPAPRVVMSDNFQSRNLDDELRGAQIRHARAQAELEAAEKHLRETKAAVARWDEAHK